MKKRPTHNRNWALTLLVLTVGLAGCGRSKLLPETQLALPPVGDSGVADGWYYQTEYGFALPIPKAFGAYAPEPDDLDAEELDEWVRFLDVKHGPWIKIMTQPTDPTVRYKVDDLEKTLARILDSAAYKVQGIGKKTGWKAGSDEWTVVPYDLQDRVQKQWRTWACVMQHGDFVVWARATLPRKDADGPSGSKFLEDVRIALTQIRWYEPIGPRGISLENYELKNFNDGFLAALESGRVDKTLAYFDETSPARLTWTDWYRKQVPAEAKGNSLLAGLKAQTAGLVIDGKKATAFFLLEKTGQAPTKLGFRLNKDEGSWRIVAQESLKP